MPQNAATARKMKSRQETTSSQPRLLGFSLHLFFKGKALGTRLPPTAKLRQWRQSRQRQAFINTDTRRFKIQKADVGPPPPHPPAGPQNLSVFFCSWSFGLAHDGDNNPCPGGAYIMSAVLPGGVDAFKWSTCSKEKLQEFLRYWLHNVLW